MTVVRLNVTATLCADQIEVYSANLEMKLTFVTFLTVGSHIRVDASPIRLYFLSAVFM